MPPPPLCSAIGIGFLCRLSVCVTCVYVCPSVHDVFPVSVVCTKPLSVVHLGTKMCCLGFGIKRLKVKVIALPNMLKYHFCGLFPLTCLVCIYGFSSNFCS